MERQSKANLLDTSRLEEEKARSIGVSSSSMSSLSWSVKCCRHEDVKGGIPLSER